MFEWVRKIVESKRIEGVCSDTQVKALIWVKWERKRTGYGGLKGLNFMTTANLWIF